MAWKKTMTFAVVHFSVAFGVATALTGSPLIGGLIALVEPALNTLAYYVHERAWRLIEARDSRPAASSRGALSISKIGTISAA